MNAFILRIKKIASGIGTLNIALIIVCLYFFYFNCQMIELWKTTGSAPETAWTAMNGALLGECGVCGFLKNCKLKNKKEGSLNESDQ